MIRRILATLDGGRASESVVPHLEELLRHHPADVTLLTVVPKGSTHEQRVARAYLDGFAERLRSRGADVTIAIEAGEPAERILHRAIFENFDLIAMCSHGKTGLKRLLLGSVAEEVFHRSRIPVLIVPPLRPQERPAGYHRILTPVDGSARCAAVLGTAAEIGASLHAHMMVATVFPKKPDLEGPPVHAILQMMSRACHEFERHGLVATRVTRIGRTAAQILEVLVEAKVDLVAVCSPELADAVLRKGRRPLLVIRPSALQEA